MVTAGRVFSISTALFMTFAATAACAADAASRAGRNPGQLDPRLDAVSRSLQQPLVIEGRDVVRHPIEQRMKLFGVPAVSVAIIDEGRLVAAGAWGVMEAGADEPVTTDTIFQAGSVSKPVAALLALSLVRDGSLKLDQPINDVLKSWKIPENEYTQQQAVTLQLLLSHQAGLTPHAYLVPRSEGSMPGMAELLRGDIRDWPAITVESVPGSSRAYSNPAYCVLQLALEDVTGLSLHSFASKRMFGPLKMSRSYFNEPLTGTLLATAASGHRSTRDDSSAERTAVPVAGKAEMAPGAAGGLWSTPSDLAAMVVEVVAAWRGGRDRWIDPEGARLFLTPVTTDQGLGIHVSGEGQTLKATHAGQMVGFITHLVFYPNAGKGAVVMANADGARWLNPEIIAAIASEYGWPDYPIHRTLAAAPAERLLELVGDYVLDAGPGFKLAVTLEDGIAKGQINDYPPFVLEATTEPDLYVLPQQSMEILFQRSDEGAIVQAVMRRAGETGAVYARTAAP